MKLSQSEVARIIAGLQNCECVKITCGDTTVTINPKAERRNSKTRYGAYDSVMQHVKQASRIVVNANERNQIHYTRISDKHFQAQFLAM